MHFLHYFRNKYKLIIVTETFRFDPLCGTFDKKQFSEDYGFLSNIRMNDIKAIRAELKETKDPEKEIKLRRLLQRLNDQQKANKKKRLDRERQAKMKLEVEEEFKHGRQPHFKNKCEYILNFKSNQIAYLSY